MNTNNYYPLYIASVLQLAATIVIKNSLAADAVNQYTSMVLGYPLDTLDPTTWKYYMNLAGQYHPTDTMMTVTSMDTLETINFNTANLQVNVATAAAYQYGTYQYNQLVQRYPNQETLILGILYPVNLNTAIAAADGQILGYPPGLVEVNEYTLIQNLQNWITGYIERWFNPQYTLTDPLYLATSLGIMYHNLVPAILNLRLRACKTNEAHSYHVREYLASHGALDQYISEMTLSQTLFFYRNINYIERHPGSQSTFEWLVENIMTVRNLPLAQFVMKHDLTPMPNTSIYPNIVLVKQPINDIISPDQTTQVSLGEALDMENLLAIDNSLYEADYLKSITTAMQNSLSNSLMTKILESSMIDYSSDTPYTLPDILLNHWIWLASERLYISYITVENPQTGESISLPALDAFILMWYVYFMASGVQIGVVPDFFAKRVQRIPLPTIADMMSVVDTKIVDQSIAVQALSYNSAIPLIISREAFYEECTSIYNGCQEQLGLVSNQQDYIRRAMVQNMVDRIYSDSVINTFESGQTYAQWFQTRNLDISTMSKTDLQTLYTSLLQSGTGQDLNPATSLSDLQAAMIKMLGQLSSYTIQIIGSINATSLIDLNWTATRLSTPNVSASADSYIDDMMVQPISMDVSGTQTLNYDVNPPFAPSAIMDVAYATVDFNLPNLIPSCESHLTIDETWDMVSFGVSYQTPLPTNDENIIPVLGLETFLALNPAQRSQLKFVTNQ